MKGILRMTGWLVVAAALMAGISACNTADKLQPEDEMPAVDAPKTYTLTVTATKGEDDTTRALSLDGKTLNATWTAGDIVIVTKDLGGTSQEYGTLRATNVSTDGLTCTLTGELSPAPSEGDELTLTYNGEGYGLQQGTLEYIAAHCDIAVATVTVDTVDDGQVTTTAAANFVSQQAIVKFTLKKPDGTTLFPATSLNVKYGKKTFKVRPDAAMSELFAAIPGSSGSSVTVNKGEKADYTIGKSINMNDYICGTVKIGDTTYYDGSSFQNGGNIYLAASPYIYQP